MTITMQTQVSPAPKPVHMTTHSHLLQRKCACGGMPGPTGECGECRKKNMQTTIQRKMRMNAPGDIFEQEADRVAQAVVSGAGFGQDVSQPAGSHLMRQVPSCSQEATISPLVNETLHSAGIPLDAETRKFMERRFGYDFSRVRIHNDSTAARSAQEINALAYTVGHNIVFGAGQFMPASTTGRKLIAHELTHVVQQGHRTPIGKKMPPAMHSVRLILPSGERFIAPPGALSETGSVTAASPTAESPIPGEQQTMSTARQPGEESEPSLQRMIAVHNHYEDSSWLIQRTASFINPTPVAHDPLARLAAGDPPGLTTPTINGQVVTSDQDVLTQVTPTQVVQTGSSGGQVTCRVDPGFTINTSANMIVSSNAGATGWTGNVPPALLGNPAVCAGRPQIPATMNALPNNADFVARVRTSEQEHADELRTLHNRHFVPYDRFVMGLTGTGADLNAAGQDLVRRLGNRPLQATLGFVLGNQAQVRRLDGPGGTHADTAVPTIAPGCASVAITLSQTTPHIPASAPGNVVPIAPTTTTFNPARLTVSGNNLVEGPTVIKRFSSVTNAQLALRTIRHYGMNSRNVIGSMEYFLVFGTAPGGSFGGVSELAIDPAFHQVSFGVPGANDWAITQVIGNNINVLVNFGNSRNEAYSAWQVLQAFGFTHQCWIGGTRQSPEMMYFRVDAPFGSEPGDYPLRTLPEGMEYA